MRATICEHCSAILGKHTSGTIKSFALVSTTAPNTADYMQSVYPLCDECVRRELDKRSKGLWERIVGWLRLERPSKDGSLLGLCGDCSKVISDRMKGIDRRVD